MSLCFEDDYLFLVRDAVNFGINVQYDTASYARKIFFSHLVFRTNAKHNSGDLDVDGNNKF